MEFTICTSEQQRKQQDSTFDLPGIYYALGHSSRTAREITRFDTEGLSITCLQSYSFSSFHLCIVSRVTQLVVTNTTYCLPFTLFTCATATPFLPKNFFIFSSATSSAKPRTYKSLPANKCVNTFHALWFGYS